MQPNVVHGIIRITAHADWQFVNDHISELLNRAQTELENSNDTTQIHRMQGRIKALKELSIIREKAKDQLGNANN